MQGMADVLGDYTYPHERGKLDDGREPPAEVTDFIGRESR